MSNFSHYLSIALAVIGCILIITGRVLSYHLTEGEALVQYWFIWLPASICLFAGILIVKYGDTDEKI